MGDLPASKGSHSDLRVDCCLYGLAPTAMPGSHTRCIVVAGLTTMKGVSRLRELSRMWYGKGRNTSNQVMSNVRKYPYLVAAMVVCHAIKHI